MSDSRNALVSNAYGKAYPAGGSVEGEEEL